MRRIRPGLTVAASMQCVGLLAVVFLSGCGESDWGYVEGVVTLQGEPVGPGTLILSPSDPGKTRSAIAHFGEDGRYEIKSAGNKRGVPAGEYRVRIDPGGEQDFGDEQAGPPTGSKIPLRLLGYGAGLTATVQAGNNTINLELAPDGAN